MDYTILVGTTDTGLMRSFDGGDTWERFGARPIWGQDHVFDVRVSPHDPNLVFAGCNLGLYRSTDRARTWEKLDVLIDKMPVYLVSYDPTDPDTVFFATRPSYVFRSRNRGKTWEMLDFPAAKECVIGTSHPTGIVVDRKNPNMLWIGIEVDGLYRSDDYGESWTRMPTRSQTYQTVPPPEEDPLIDPDIHNLASFGPGRENLLVTTPRQLYMTGDQGKTWSTVIRTREHFEQGYIRYAGVKEDDSNVLFLAGGPNVFGQEGAIHRSKDGGKTWETADLPEEPESNVRSFATNPADPNLILASTDCGKLYRTTNGGDSWERLKRGFSGIKSVAWMPNG